MKHFDLHQCPECGGDGLKRGYSCPLCEGGGRVDGDALYEWELAERLRDETEMREPSYVDGLMTKFGGGHK